jgi:hypothetical protein
VSEVSEVSEVGWETVEALDIKKHMKINQDAIVDDLAQQP